MPMAHAGRLQSPLPPAPTRAQAQLPAGHAAPLRCRSSGFWLLASGSHDDVDDGARGGSTRASSVSRGALPWPACSPPKRLAETFRQSGLDTAGLVEAVPPGHTVRHWTQGSGDMPPPCLSIKAGTVAFHLASGSQPQASHRVGPPIATPSHFAHHVRMGPRRCAPTASDFTWLSAWRSERTVHPHGRPSVRPSLPQE